MNNNIQRKRLVTETLIKIGADIADRGFYMLRDAILAYMEYELPASVRQQDILTPIGEKYGISHITVYCDIRLLIENIMLCMDTEFLESYFGRRYRPDKGSVMPKAFIIRIVDDVKLRCEELSKKGDADMPAERKQVIEEINKEIEGISNIAKIRFILGIVRSYKNDIDNK